MRVISGFLKSRTIKVPSSVKNLRPTTDRARETLFNVISSRFNIYGMKVLDLYCGSGSFGIECISRNASKCSFVDKFPDTAKRNITDLGIADKSLVIKEDVIRFLKGIKSLDYDIVFADPPYDYLKYNELIDLLSGFQGIFILEHSEKYLPLEIHSKYIFLKKKVGISAFTFFDFKQQDDE
jgi:16S rRNA (guanine(966)-N(2))-methyltransferase RsmD